MNIILILRSKRAKWHVKEWIVVVSYLCHLASVPQVLNNPADTSVTVTASSNDFFNTGQDVNTGDTVSNSVADLSNTEKAPI